MMSEEAHEEPVYYVSKLYQDQCNRVSFSLGVKVSSRDRRFTGYEMLFDTGSHCIILPASVARDPARGVTYLKRGTNKRPPGMENDHIFWQGEKHRLFFGEVRLQIRDEDGYCLIWNAIVGFWEARELGLFGMSEGAGLFRTAYDPTQAPKPTLALQPTEAFWDAQHRGTIEPKRKP